MKRYDVAIVGGGPAGSTLASLLCSGRRHSVVLLEKERFPREHIGESFAHRAMPILALSGVLPKVLASDCWIKKYGGYYAWDAEAPSVSRFENANFQRDGVHRWAIHVNRPEFDHILLEHAAASGAQVRQECPVRDATYRDGEWHFVLGNGEELVARYAVEASGRQTSLVTGARREYLSRYKNVAIWLHVLGGRAAQSLPGDWNIFRQEDLSAIGSFAFEDGWFWYIPVPRTVAGQRVVTHSLGLVTDPETLKARRDMYLDPRHLLATARKVPLLSELIREASPVAGEVHTATNYSMISERFCEFERRWMLIGDSAFFVDPLFSSGVAFAVNQAATAALLIDAALDGAYSDDEVSTLWEDHDASWRRIARGFALMIDQWYHAIARENPESEHWRGRASFRHRDLEEATLTALVDTDISPDLIDVITKHSGRLGDGPLASFRAGRPAQPRSDEMLGLRDDVSFRRGLSLGLDRLGRTPPKEHEDAIRAWWRDPIEHAGKLPAPFRAPIECVWVGRDGMPRVALYGEQERAVRALPKRAPCATWEAALGSSGAFARLWEAGVLEKKPSA